MTVTTELRALQLTQHKAKEKCTVTRDTNVSRRHYKVMETQTIPTLTYYSLYVSTVLIWVSY